MRRQTVKGSGVSKSFSWTARIRSFGYALAGLRFLVRTQHNAWIHLAATIVVIAAGLVLQVSNADWRWLVVAIAAVWAAEAINTALEQLCDLVSPGYDIAIEHAKDVAAGAVLITAVGAAVIGVLVFWPYLTR